MDSSVFVEYETDLVTVLKSVSDKIGGEAHALRGGASSGHAHSSTPPPHTLRADPARLADDRKNLLSRLSRELEEADEIVRALSPPRAARPL